MGQANQPDTGTFWHGPVSSSPCFVDWLSRQTCAPAPFYGWPRGCGPLVAECATTCGNQQRAWLAPLTCTVTLSGHTPSHTTQSKAFTPAFTSASWWPSCRTSGVTRHEPEAPPLPACVCPGATQVLALPCSLPGAHVAPKGWHASSTVGGRPVVGGEIVYRVEPRGLGRWGSAGGCAHWERTRLIYTWPANTQVGKSGARF